MVNVANGNLIVQADDMSVANKGIALAFRRTYNSMSQHDTAGSDGSTPSNYGNGWTNTFDAHLATNSLGGITVFDIDGARYDYGPNGKGGYTPPAGVRAVLTFDGGNGYYWTKKSGTVYYFYGPTQPSQSGGLSGRLYRLYGRNSNDYLAFSYAFDGGNESSASYLSQVVVTTEDGRSATLQFADFSGHRLLASLTWPNATVVSYKYDGNANLTEVDEPGNNAASSLPQEYGWTGNHQLLWASSPRWVLSGGGGADGAYVQTNYLANGELSALAYTGVVNPTINDGTNSGALQPSMPSGAQTFRTVSYTYGTGATTFADSDGHQTTYAWDAIGRVTQIQDWTGSITLTRTQTWNVHNELAATTDDRGNQTDYAYDANGNVIAVGQPSVTTSLGTFRPTSYYGYDGNSNLIAYCDPIWVHNHGDDWNLKGPPAESDLLCPQQSGGGALREYWTSPSGGYEPKGELTEIVTPRGYKRFFAYNATAQGGADYGLPTDVTGDSFTESDGTVITPHQSFVYDGHGNLVCYSKGVGFWILQYDTLGRLTASADPDDASVSNASCAKTPGLPGSHIVTARTYYPNGEVASTQSPSEYAEGVSTTYAYDRDGDQIAITTHDGSTPSAPKSGTTTKWYDGLDRLIEVQEPHDSADAYSYSWLTRYLYDLTEGRQSLSLANGPAFAAHGNLFKTQEFLGAYSVSGSTAIPLGTGSPVWTDMRGTAYDALDRPVAEYRYIPSDTAVHVASNAYDANGNQGLLEQSCNAAGPCTNYVYDALARVASLSFSGDGGVTPSRSYTYDPDGRTVSVRSSVYGSQNSVFDADGRLIASYEASDGGVTSPASITYGVYPNGWRSKLSVTSSGLTQANLISYVYRADGLKTKEVVDYGSSQSFGWSFTAAGRHVQRTDPYTGTSISGLQQAGYAAASFVPMTWQYDPDGRLSYLTLPSHAEYQAIQ
ncbi:MAG: RHS repeat protein, partial [bacterium]|nr:RHS repeat protein [bacterium]